MAPRSGVLGTRKSSSASVAAVSGTTATALTDANDMVLLLLLLVVVVLIGDVGALLNGDACSLVGSSAARELGATHGAGEAVAEAAAAIEWYSALELSSS